MYKNGYKILLAIILFSFLFHLESYADKKIKNIVILFPLNASMPSYQIFLEGFKSTFPEKFEEPYNLVVEYLDIGRSTDNDYAKHIVKIYNEKIKTSPIDLLITIPPFTYELMQQYGLDALSNTPTLHFKLPQLADTPSNKSSVTHANRNTLEITLNYEISKTMLSAFELFPSYKDVYIISGSSFTDMYFTGLTKESTKGFTKSHNFIFRNGITLDSTINFVKQIPAKSIVIVPMYLSDSKNVPFSTPEALSLISGNCSAPVFPVTDSYTKKKGGIGGNLFSYYFFGEEIGVIVREVLNGKQIKEINVNEIHFYKHIYDWKELKRWNLLESKSIPENSIFFNMEFDFFTEYKWYMLAILIFLMLQTSFIVYQHRLNKRQKEVARHKEETENLYRQLVREDRLSRMAVLTASLSHELNQPLTAIMYNAQAGRRFHKSGKLVPERADEIFEKIIENDKRAGELVSSVRDLMKLETREQEKVNISAVIQDSLNIYHSEAIGKQIQVKVNLPDEQVNVIGDKIQLQQVVLNFLSNAAIAMENTTSENKLIEISQRADKDSVILAVRDYGSGISDSIKDSLFQPFITTHKKGFGIGLAISRSIIERHQGEMFAENMAGGGAEFSFHLKKYRNE